MMVVAKCVVAVTASTGMLFTPIANAILGSLLILLNFIVMILVIHVGDKLMKSLRSLQ